VDVRGDPREIGGRERGVLVWSRVESEFISTVSSPLSLASGSGSFDSS
jgi:hypothetical protein